MRAFRRAVTLAAICSVVAAILRFRSGGTKPERSGGWRELSGPDLS